MRDQNNYAWIYETLEPTRDYCLMRYNGVTFHVLHNTLKHTGYNLRSRAHDYELPDKDDHNFIERLLYKKIYCKKT